ncbi:MAG: 16S rRNA (cytidine(1402)-2'-O)-methyltransferase [Candidatus Sulfobium sp.]|jgi:16S rRNA (cytidine1402-2'-O)-methyltransferase
MPTGRLYIVATPIGNLEDITLRALRVLKEADVIAAEDTRHSLRLLNHYGISRQLVSYWGEKEKVRAEETISLLKAGKNVALISDAGTPGIADPGSVLIRRAWEEGIRVEAVPGPAAVIAALSVSGFSTEEFMFCGFLPSKQSRRRKLLEELSREKRTVVFYEAPHRIMECFGDIAELFGDRKTVVAREMTKLHEEITRGDAVEIRERLEGSVTAGEYVVVIEGRRDEKSPAGEEALKEVGALMKKGFGRKEAVKRVATEYGLSRKELYDRSLSGG